MLSKKDLVILSHLRQDSRMPLTRMSRKTAIPVSTIFDKLKLYEKELIKNYTALIDFSVLGYNARAKIVLKVDREQRNDLEEYLIKHENLNSVYRINNGYDFLVEGIFRHLKDTEDFMENIEKQFKIKSKSVFYIIDDIKREAFLSDPAVLDLFGE